MLIIDSNDRNNSLNMFNTSNIDSKNNDRRHSTDNQTKFHNNDNGDEQYIIGYYIYTYINIRVCIYIYM